MRFLRHAAAVALKDLRVEARTRELLSAMVFFAAMVCFIGAFSFVDGVESTAHLASGVLWISVAFSGALGLSRAFDREREGNTMRALLLSPAERGAVFLGKAAGVAIFMLIVEVVVVILLVGLFNTPIARVDLLALFLILVPIGFSVVGSVFAGMLLRARAREVLLAVSLYPIVTPALIAGTKGTAAILVAEAVLPNAWFWIKFLAVFDGIFLSIALFTFESLVIE